MDTPRVGIVLGVVAIGILLLVRRKRTNLQQAAVVFLAALGITAGAKVCVVGFTLSPAQLQALQIDPAYLVFGGIALIWVSGLAIWQTMTAP